MKSYAEVGEVALFLKQRGRPKTHSSDSPLIIYSGLEWLHEAVWASII